MIGAASMVPALFFGPIAGATADRYGHRRQLVCAATTGATAAFIMAAFTLVGLMNEELLLGLASIGGTTRAFTVPARNAMVHDLVEKSHLSAAIGVNAATYQGTTFIGAAMGGGIVVWAGSAFAFIAYGAGVLFAVVQVLRLQLPPSQRKGIGGTSFCPNLGPGSDMPMGMAASGPCF
jgi:MFS family permease